MKRIDKENYYLDIAESVLERSTCIRRCFGSVIVKNDEIISTGYNGAPRGRKNCVDLGYCTREKLNIPRGERYELCRSVHGEENAIISYQELLKANGKEISKDETKFDLNDFFEELVDKTKKSYNLSDINKTGDLSIITIDDDMEEQNNFESGFDIQKPVEEINNINSKSSTPMLEHIDIDKKNKKDKKFKVSEFISPIYGRIETKLDYPTIPSEDKSQKSISELKDDEFLNALKAFRQNL